MKSFFKKLAFVMAMAMVVSLAAPAAANAAEGDIYLCLQDDAEKKAVTSIVMKENDEPVDLRFINAPKDWKELGWEYKMADDTIATVDPAGVVTPVAEGATTLDFYLGGEKKVSLFVKVDPVVPKNEYTLKQTTHEAFTLTYAQDVTYKLSDVQLYVVRTNVSTGETFDVPWPLHETKSKVEKNVITVVPFVALPDGTAIKVVVDGVEKNDTVKVGDITSVEIVNLSGTDTVFYKEEKTDNFYLKYGFKLYSGEIDVTGYYTELRSIKWSATTGDPVKDQDLEFDSTGDETFELAFWADKLNAAVSLEIKDLDDKKFTALPVGAYSEKQPVWALKQDVVWTITKGDKIDWSKPVHSLPADAKTEEYIVVLKFESTRGDKYVTHEYGKVVVDGDKNTYKLVKDATELDKYELTFNSANESDLLIDPETGALGVYKETAVLFYVGQKIDKGATTYVCADWITVTEASNLAYVEVDTKATGDAIKDGVVTVTTLTMAGYENLANKSVFVKAKTQDNKTAWDKVAYTVAVSVKAAEDAVKVVGNEIQIIGANLADVTSRSFTVTVTGTSTLDGTTKAGTSFTVAIKSVDIADDNDDPRFVVNASGSDKKIVLDTKYTRDCIEYTDITIGDDGKVAVDLAKVDAKGNAYAEIKLYKTSDDQIVGQYTEADGILVATSKDDIDKNPAFLTEGARYISIKNGDKFVTGFWDGDVFKIPFNSTKADGEMVYGDKGEYKIEVVTVRYYQSRENKTNNYTVEGTLSVDNTKPEVTKAGTRTTTYTKKNIEDIVVETIKFNLGNDEWKLDSIKSAMITDVDYVEVAGTIIIRNVTFKVPVDGKTVDAPFYYKTVYGINVAVKPAE